MTHITTNSQVRFLNPMNSIEEAQTFTVVDDRGPRMLIISNESLLTIPGTLAVRTSELELI